jgi:Protein of unknown function (DUF3048) N-terminal domain/Protein of unknown function (DUF3048) C-terminal domain
MPRAALAVLVAATLAACSGSDEAADTTPPSSSIAVTTTVRSTTTTQNVTTTTAVPGPAMPLTGLPVEDEAVAARPALVVKIDNHPKAVPQSGLEFADIVYEENVEQLTRFAAVFHSVGSEPVGPIRSGRTQDVELLATLGQPLFAWSGGNPTVTRLIESSGLVSLNGARSDVYNGGGFFRSDRPGPHDLYASTAALWTLAPFGAPPPPQQFLYRDDTEVPEGDEVAGVEVRMDNVQVLWTWDETLGAYLRQQNGQPHLDVAGEQLQSANVIVLTVEYRPSRADVRSPEAQTVGSGEALVLTGGVVVRGTWQRDTPQATFTLADSSGATIELAPGRTWVELARTDSTTLRP